ncbi:MAG: hypothetical protein ACQEP1_05890 [Nanobdellota archaeon]
MKNKKESTLEFMADHFVEYMGDIEEYPKEKQEMILKDLAEINPESVIQYSTEIKAPETREIALLSALDHINEKDIGKEGIDSEFYMKMPQFFRDNNKHILNKLGEKLMDIDTQSTYIISEIYNLDELKIKAGHKLLNKPKSSVFLNHRVIETTSHLKNKPIDDPLFLNGGHPHKDGFLRSAEWLAQSTNDEGLYKNLFRELINEKDFRWAFEIGKTIDSEFNDKEAKIYARNKIKKTRSIKREMKNNNQETVERFLGIYKDRKQGKKAWQTYLKEYYSFAKDYAFRTKDKDKINEVLEMMVKKEPIKAYENGHLFEDKSLVDKAKKNSVKSMIRNKNYKQALENFPDYKDHIENKWIRDKNNLYQAENYAETTSDNNLLKKIALRHENKKDYLSFYRVASKSGDDELIEKAGEKLVNKYPQNVINQNFPAELKIKAIDNLNINKSMKDHMKEQYKK